MSSGETIAFSEETKLEFLLNTCLCLSLRLNPPAFDKLMNTTWFQLTCRILRIFHETQPQFLFQNRVCDGHVESL